MALTPALSPLGNLGPPARLTKDSAWQNLKLSDEGGTLPLLAKAIMSVGSCYEAYIEIVGTLRTKCGFGS